MGSLLKTYTQEKLFGQVYTPHFVVCKILDDLGYKGKRLLGKTVIDPACGDGRFLEEVVRRIVKHSSEYSLKENLKYVYGWDIDADAIKDCIHNLNNLVGFDFDWNIEFKDALQQKQNPDLFSISQNIKFDFVVGNPPYIRIQHLGEHQRLFIQKHYDFCKSGSTDIYIAFYELALSLLSPNGVAGFITPNTFLYTATAGKMRQRFKNNQSIIQITNYGDIQLFEDATTYSAIVLFSNKKQDSFIYQKAETSKSFKEKCINFTVLEEPFWQLSLKDTSKKAGIKLKNICTISVGLQTLCDKAYIFPIIEKDDEVAVVDTKLKGKISIEKDILRPIIKASKIKNSADKITEYILFPYKKIDGKNKIIPENELSTKYPLAYAYLKSVKDELDKRDNGKPNPIAWYAYGRSLGLDNSFGEKILFSPMNKKPNFVYYKNKNATFYSGYSIKYEGDLKKLLPYLNSEEMQKYIKASSRDFRNGWKAYNKKIVENFRVANRL